MINIDFQNDFIAGLAIKSSRVVENEGADFDHTGIANYKLY